MTFDSSSAKNTRQLRLGLFVQPLGHHISGWHLTENLDSPTDVDWLTETTKKTEEGKLDMFFVGDVLVTSAYQLSSTVTRLKPLTLLPALTVQTRHIGLAATASTTFSNPFNLTRSFSSLDHISHGHAAWNVVTLLSADVARNFSRGDTLIHAERYAVAHEFLGATFKLWEG